MNDDGPFFLLRQSPWSAAYAGPFTSAHDANTARSIATKSWESAVIAGIDEWYKYKAKYDLG